MKVVGWFLVGCLGLALLRTTVTAVLAALALAFVIALVAAPYDTLKVLFGLALISAFGAHPLAGLLLATAMLLCAHAAK